jgi:hypothetical protein
VNAPILPSQPSRRHCLPNPPSPRTEPSSHRQSLPLNPNAAAFSLDSTSPTPMGDGTLDWLRFSPSSSEDMSSALGHHPSTSSTRSFTEVVRDKGKAPMEEEGSSRGSSHGSLNASHHEDWGGVSTFMVDARRTGHRAPPPPPPHLQADPNSWQMESRHKQWHRLTQQALPPPPSVARCLVSANLIGHCFNCLQEDHITVVCPNAARCLSYHREGHQARSCKRLRSLDSVGPPRRQPRPSSTVVVLNPRKGYVVVATEQDPPTPRHSLPAQSNRQISLRRRRV